MKNLKRIMALAGLGMYSLAGAQYLDLPSSDCKLSWHGFRELIETYEMPRKRFDGCISFCSDLLADFVPGSRPNDPCSLRLENLYDPESTIRFWVYRNSGRVQFLADNWNRLIGVLLENYPGEFTAVLEKPFKDDRDAAAPMLEHVPLKGIILIKRIKDGKIFRTHLSLVPVKGSDKILVVELRSSGSHYPYMGRVYESFLKGLYFSP